MDKEEIENGVREVGEGWIEDENIKLVGFGCFPLWCWLKYGLFRLKRKY
jgi:hypothetical protein